MAKRLKLWECKYFEDGRMSTLTVHAHTETKARAFFKKHSTAKKRIFSVHPISALVKTPASKRSA